MKKLVFVDYDWEQDSEDDIRHFKRVLRYFGEIEASKLANIECHFRIGDKSNEELAQILFDKDSILLTYSMFTSVHYGSLYALLYFLEIAGKQQIKDKVYIDCSTYLLDTLNRNVVDLDSQEAKDIMKCVTNNHIIGYNDGEFQKISLSGDQWTPFKGDKVDLNNYFA